MNEEIYDLIVVGAGAGGMAAAATAASRGCKVLLLEHSDRIGGTTAISGGMVWIPANHMMASVGVQDTPDEAWQYLSATVPDAADDPRLRAYVQEADAALKYLQTHTALKFRPVPRYPDYYPDLRGATPGGRVLEPLPFDGRELGKQFSVLRDPLPEFTLFGGMMISREDIPKLRRVGRSFGATAHVMKLLCRYGRQRMVAHRGTTLYLGNALAGRLFKSVLDLGVTIHRNARVLQLDATDGRIVGLQYKRDGQVIKVRAARGVVLATGGISHDAELRAHYVPPTAGCLSATVNAQADVSGVRIARNLGAAISSPRHTADQALAFWVPASTWKRQDGSEGLFPHTVTDRAKPGLIAVNQRGERFVNEAVSYHEFVKAQLAPQNDAIPAWLICDHDFLWKYGLGKIRPFSLSVQSDVATGYLKKAPSLEALAADLGLPVQKFNETLRRYNEDARDGKDKQFGRGENIYQRHLGDGDHQPNPCVAEIKRAPFYAVKVVPADLGMAAGLLTDTHGRVLDAEGRPVQGLYACGNDMSSVMNGAYPGPGITLGPALVFGFIAARHACEFAESHAASAPCDAQHVDALLRTDQK